jgi:tetratricopeptide (TPR) repeat protein
MALDSFQQALALIQADQPFEALPLLNELIGEQPQHREAYLARARVRRRLQDREGAIADYSKALKLSPKAETYLARSLVWLSLNNMQGAIADSREAIALNPKLAGAHRLLGKALGQLGDGVGAIAAYKQAARCYLDARDKANAQACLDAIGPLRALPDYPAGRQANDYAQSSVSGFAGAQGERATPAEFVRRVRLMYERGEYAAALKELDWLLGCEPQAVEALCLRGLTQAQLGRREQAVADLAQAKQLQPEDVDVRFCRGQMRLIFKDGYGAIEEFSALITAAADKPESKYFAQRGDGYRLLEDYDQAFKDYSNAIALDTENAQLYELRAKMQQDMGASKGANEEAIADYQQAATLWLNEGNWQKHQQVVETVRSLRKSNSSNSSRSKSNSSATVQIKSFNNQMPVVEVLFDGIASFDIVIDRNATHSIVTQQMANRLKLDTVSYRYVYLADGTPMELSIGRLRSVAIGTTIITDVYVAIAPDNATAVLGKDCFSAYSVRISGNEMTFVRRGI